MEKKLAEIYNKLANQIVKMIPVEWEDIYYLGEVESGRKSWSSVFYYRDTNSDEIVKSNRIPNVYNVPMNIFKEFLGELNEILLQLYSCFEDNEQELWEQVSLSLSSTGKFNVEFQYNVIGKNDESQVEREVIWAYKTFGYMPKDGTYTRKVLDSYLQNRDDK
jgi:uncharacterized protein (TIGR01741 family)